MAEKNGAKNGGQFSDWIITPIKYCNKAIKNSKDKQQFKKHTKIQRRRAGGCCLKNLVNNQDIFRDFFKVTEKGEQPLIMYHYQYAILLLKLLYHLVKSKMKCEQRGNFSSDLKRERGSFKSETIIQLICSPYFIEPIQSLFSGTNQFQKNTFKLADCLPGKWSF